MPVESQAQRRFMYATEEGKTDVSPSVGREFVNASHGLKGLPDHVHGRQSTGAKGHNPGSALRAPDGAEMHSPMIKPSRKGLLHEKLGVPLGEKIPAAKIAKAKLSSSPALRKEATFAQNFGHADHAATETPKPNSSKPRVVRTRPEPRRALAIPMVKPPAAPNRPEGASSDDSDDSESPGVGASGSSYVPGLDDDEDLSSITRGLFHAQRGR